MGCWTAVPTLGPPPRPPFPPQHTNPSTCWMARPTLGLPSRPPFPPQHTNPPGSARSDLPPRPPSRRRSRPLHLPHFTTCYLIEYLRAMPPLYDATSTAPTA